MSDALHRSRRTRDVRRVQYAANVREAVGQIYHGCEIYGLCRGQYSLIDIVEYILRSTGPADIVLSTWTAAGADIDYALRLRRDGHMRSIRWVIDASFPIRQPAYCVAMREHFGDDSIRVTENHAKFVLISNADWHIALRTSMNFNENRRLESWEISDDATLHAYLSDVVTDLFTTGNGTEQLDSSRQASRSAFDADSRSRIAPRTRLRYIK